MVDGIKQVGGTHYEDMDIQPWDIIATWPPEQRLGYFRGCALKYIMRAGSKGSVVDDMS